MESSMSSQANQPYSLVNRINLDIDFEQLMFSQECYPNHNYSMGYGSAPVNEDEEDDSPVEEVSPVKPKKPSRCIARAKKNDPKEPPKERTVEEEIVLCQAWCDVSENNVVGNSIKTKGFWDAFITYFEKETGSSTGSPRLVADVGNLVQLWESDHTWKWVWRGLILNGMLDSLIDIYQNVESSKELWDSLEAKYMAEDASSKKFLVSNFTNYKMTDSRPVLEQYNELLSILERFTQHKMNMDEAIQVSCIIDKLSPSWKDFKHTLKHLKEELTLVELGSHLRIEESLRVQDSDKPKGNNVAGPLVVNMVDHNNSSRYNENKGKHKHHDNTRADPNKKAKPTCWKCGKTSHIKRDCKGVNVGDKANGSGTKGSMDGSSNSLKGQNIFNKSLQVYYVTYVSEAYFVQDDDVAWWVDSGATVHVCKDKCWFKTYESLNYGSILHMGNESAALVHRRGCVDLRFSSRKIVSLFNVLHVPNISKNLVSSSVLNNCGYKQVIESNKFVLSKHGV
ncbi:zinc finger, CCHC-type containing protein [Tanacetum coccineum]